MALVNKNITPGEKAAIWYHVFSGCEDWRLLYAMADGIKDQDKIKTLNRSTIYAWKTSEKIQNLLREAERAKFELIKAAEMQGYEDGKKEGTDNIRPDDKSGTIVPKGSTRYIDYSDPAAQTRKLNELVNTADDPGEALDALKVIIQTQKADREAAKEGKQVRVYLPISCTGCPLYKLQVKKRERNGENLQ